MNLKPGNLETIAALGGRALIASLFIFAGLIKILTPQPFLDHMVEFGVPAILLPGVIALELGAGVALLIGWRVREVAAVLAVFCLLTAFIFHHELGIKTERTLFFKDLAIAGGLFTMATTAAVIQRLARAGKGSPELSAAERPTASLDASPKSSWKEFR
jgi:putative oxidoreductase